MQESLTFLSAEMSVGIAEDESNSREEVTLSRTIAADNDVVFRGEWLNDRLIFVAEVRAKSIKGHKVMRIAYGVESTS